MGLTERDAVRSRNFKFERVGGRWTVNGHTWEDVINSDYDFVLANPGFEDVEIWELENPGGGWFHPVHIHLVDFKVLDRNGRPPLPHELGPKDVVYVGEGEKVRVIMRFEHQQGKYMIHCHNLVHEDHDMMGQFQVGDDGGRHHPVRADRARNLPAGPLFTRPDDHSGHGSGSGGHGGGPGPSKPKSPKSSKFRKKSKRCKTVTKKVKVRGRVRRKKVVKCKPKATHRKATHKKVTHKKAAARRGVVKRKHR
jgi:Multicopper oxidase